METVVLTCDFIPCRERLPVIGVEDEYGPWRGDDAKRLTETAARYRWSAEIDPRDGYAFVLCPKHVTQAAYPHG